MTCLPPPFCGRQGPVISPFLLASALKPLSVLSDVAMLCVCAWFGNTSVGIPSLVMAKHSSRVCWVTRLQPNLLGCDNRTWTPSEVVVVLTVMKLTGVVGLSVYWARGMLTGVQVFSYNTMETIPTTQLKALILRQIATES